jgi:hypothetical protein
MTMEREVREDVFEVFFEPLSSGTRRAVTVLWLLSLVTLLLALGGFQPIELSIPGLKTVVPSHAIRNAGRLATGGGVFVVTTYALADGIVLWHRWKRAQKDLAKRDGLPPPMIGHFLDYLRDHTIWPLFVPRLFVPLGVAVAAFIVAFVL